jgi:hypothetical protein
VILHAGITFGRSKRLKSQLYLPIIALSCFSAFIAASDGHTAPLNWELCSWDSNMGVQMGV